MSETFEEIIAKLWTTPERAEWIPKTDTVALSDVQRWMASNDIEILGFTYSLISNVRFRVEPPISLSEYVEFIKRYYERCLRENPDGEWSDSNYSAGVDLVNLFAALWRDSSVPRAVLADLKNWLGQLYKRGDSELRTCIVHAALEHMFEQKEIREFFSDWAKDQVLAVAHEEASEWYKGGGTSPLGKPPSGPK
ncbi:MAG: hypothetical protein DMG32_26570 [Acidobacteria bacterium]|nr:MAG: hypothetical protein DMG32_26570 [Acidobacteriota bacterium]